MSQEGFWLSLAKITGMLFSLLFAIAMANLIPQEVFGTYKFVLSAASVIGAFSLAGIGAAITQAVARGYEGSLRSGVQECLKWSFGTIAISLGAAIYYFYYHNYTLAVSFVIIGFCSPLITSYSLFVQFIAGKKDFKTNAIYDSAKNIIPGIVLILTVFFTGNAVVIVLMYFVSSVIVAFLLHQRTVREYRPNNEIDPQTISYGWHLSVMGVMGKAAEHIDKILVFHYLGAAQLAIYAFAQTPIAQLKLLNDIPAKLALPKFSERNFLELQKSLPRKILILMGIMAIVAGTYIVGAPLVFHLLFPRYLNSVIFSQILALSLILIPGTIFGSALSAHMKTKELYISQAVPLITKIGLFLLLIPPFGIWGVVWATLASQLIVFVVYAYLFLSAKLVQS